ncbi:hypothetical protein ASA1KI_24060 [Opitutales bacterium ASA1]|nr:hypothetical protein ASA1KI_24060 [Opitutales bacterium ASA1]
MVVIVVLAVMGERVSGAGNPTAMLEAAGNVEAEWSATGLAMAIAVAFFGGAVSATLWSAIGRRADRRAARAREAALSDLERRATETRAANERLSERVDELETLFRVLPVGVAIAEDAACTRVRGNAAMNQLLRLESGRNMSLSAGEEQAPKHYEIWRRGKRLGLDELPMQRAGREGEDLRDFEETVVHEDGSRHDVIADVVPLRRADGSVRGVVGVFREVTEMKRAEEERLVLERRILEAQKMQGIGRLAAGVSHDFNNLLAVVKGAAELARADPEISESVRRRLETIDFAVQRASDLCEQMLSYAGRGSMTLQKVDVNESVRRAAALVRSSFPNARDAVLELDGGVGSIDSDPSQLVQVVVNLFTNALEASEHTRAPVRISTGIVDVQEAELVGIQPVDSLVPGRCVSICVKDVGTGMDTATMRQIFTPFFSTKFQGRGLGLAAVLGIARSHRGGVRVWSQPNRGTRMEVLLPAGVVEAPRSSKSIPRAMGSSGSRRVMVVDDEPMIRRVIATYLQSQEIEVDTAAGGREALELLESAEYGLIVLDASMPEMDGYETLRRLRTSHPGMAVLVISGGDQRAVVERFRDLEPVAVLHKPFEFSALNEVVQVVFARQRRSGKSEA